MSALAIQFWPESLRSLAFGSISGTYAGIGTATLNPCRLYLIQNETDVLLTFSWDGVNDHFVVPSGAGLIVDVTSNRTSTTLSGYLAIPEGTRTYVKGSPTLGSVYLSIFYGKNG
jgi:hypothetical protein